MANYTRFEKLGFKLKIIFDINPKLVGIRIQDIEIKDIDYLTDYLKQNPIDIGILCVPNNSAQKVCDIFDKKWSKRNMEFCSCRFSGPKGYKGRECTS